MCCSCRAGFANGNHFGSLLATHFRRPTSKNGYVLVMIPQVTPVTISVKAIPTGNVSMMVRSSENKVCTVKHQQPLDALSAPRPMGQPDAPTWELLGPQGTASFWEKTDAPLPLQRSNFIHPKQFSLYSRTSGAAVSQLERSCRATRMWSLLAKTSILRGLRQTPTLSQNGTWFMFRQAVAEYRELYEGKNQPPRNISLIPRCQNALTFIRG